VAWADDFVLGYAGAIGGSDYEQGRGIAVDGAGNVYSTGCFGGTVDFDPGPGVFSLTSQGTVDVYVCKLDPSGTFQWAVSMGGSGDDLGYAIAVEDDGTVYVTGFFQGVADFDPGLGTFPLSVVGLDDIFVCKLDTVGTFQWAKAMGGSFWEYGQGIAVDGTGSVYVTGRFGDTVDFDPGPGVFNLVGTPDAFVCKLDAAGVFQWAKATTGSDSTLSAGIAVDSGDGVYITGSFRGTTDFDPGPGQFNLSSVGDRDAFLWKLDPSGSFEWVGAIGGADEDRGNGLVLDSTGGVYITGLFKDTADFDPGPGAFPVSGAGAFVCKFDTSGAIQWAGAFSTSVVNGDGLSIATDGTGGIYCSGIFEGVTDFDPGPSIFTLSGGGGAYVCKLDSTGAFRWAGAIEGIFARGYAIAADSVGNVYCTGDFEGAVDLDPGTGVQNQIGEGNLDVFILKLEPQALPGAVDEFGETNADQMLSALSSPSTNSVLTNDTDANTRRTLSVTAFDATSVLGATVVVNADGTFLYDPTAVGSLQSLRPSESRLDSFTYTLSDGTDTDVGMVTVTVYGPGTKLPASTLWGAGLLCVALAVAGIRACRLR
jgi:VCBS repeat-containing protein